MAYVPTREEFDRLLQEVTDESTRESNEHPTHPDYIPLWQVLLIPHMKDLLFLVWAMSFIGSNDTINKDGGLTYETTQQLFEKFEFGDINRFFHGGEDMGSVSRKP